ncbi:MAG: hypothetical protein MUO76_10600 [Anaerolineaceae bacterium]|nr:hypothetical protein [Anaerolineaceae bacterium]
MEDIILAIIGALPALCTGIINTLFRAWVKDDALDTKKDRYRCWKRGGDYRQPASVYQSVS